MITFLLLLFVSLMLLHQGYADGKSGDYGSKIARQSQADNNDTTVQSPPKFSMMLASPIEGESFEATVVYEDGTLMNKFEKCAIQTKRTSDEDVCFVEDVYTDRISFQYVYSGNASFKIQEPQVFAKGGTAHPVVTGFSDENLSGSFNIMYKCSPGRNEQSLISLKFGYTESEAVEMEWGKVCGSGSYPHVDFGYLLEEHLERFPKREGDSLEGLLELDPVIQTTIVVVKLKAPAEMQEFLAPSVTSSSKFVDVSLRGTTTGGTLLSDDPTQVSVIHNCHQSETESALISFTLAIPPWNNLTAEWRKDCGGNDARGLQIGTEGPGGGQVVQASKLTPEYNVSDTTKLSEALSEEKIHNVEEDMSTVTYFITNTGKDSSLHIDSLTITTSNPDVVLTRFEVPRMGSLIGTGYLDGHHRTVLASGETKNLRLHFYCRAKGQTLILVTLPIFAFKTVEFGFVKTCREPMVYHRVGFLGTAGFLWDAIIALGILSVCGFGCCYIRRKRRQVAKYDRLPQTIGGTNGTSK
eukprot:Plantae.Rhodophyta-Hildenbrandia_rubra.ctg7678.p1 GENE.Plantae.Rhodophyta-Hildenbrandia_rubra.ctg7678~~Plantae.Rhodophyta-Hildenbrandia_rubra.ctg7678.p1  ORF type:complete len:525 (-),score=79.72 Plantae.Rhodophyta-Hildenbrandia_rubra.ctg7678:8330-9904(-)